jgi:hypothetical protein
MPHEFCVCVSSTSTEGTGGSYVNSASVLGHFIFVRGPVSATPAAGQGIVLCDTGDIARKRCGRCGCDGISVRVVRGGMGKSGDRR